MKSTIVITVEEDVSMYLHAKSDDPSEYLNGLVRQQMKRHPELTQDAVPGDTETTQVLEDHLDTQIPSAG
jgi:hypothetical protein